MRQTFDMTFCDRFECTNTSCHRRMDDETSDASYILEDIIISFADFKTPDCGYEVKND